MNTDKKKLREFGISMGIVFIVLTGLVYFKRHQLSLPLCATALTFLISAFLLPVILKPLYIIWMKALFPYWSWFFIRINLVLVFYLILTPIGLAIRLFGRDLLERKIQKEKDSYWKKKQITAIDYERQF